MAASSIRSRSCRLSGRWRATTTAAPTWYAAFSDTFRCACIALTPPGGFVYWDSGLRGQISLDAGAAPVEKRLFLWGPGATDDAFAKAAAAACAEGAKVTPVPGG